MKKLLALMMALVMSLSLVTISNADFNDADSIDYTEAVEVMNAVGVLEGMGNNNFDPKGNLTREQAAKIVAYLELGQKTADAIVGSKIFADVALDRWSAGYISYCASAGIIAGVGDGKFDPTSELTAMQFGKMLLIVLGYDAKAESLVGTDWSINTSRLMVTAGLMKDLDINVNSVLTREQAAQMLLNAIEAPMVTYETKGSSISVNGAEISFGASTAKYETSTIAKDQNISKEKLTSGEYTVELGEKLYKDLKKSSTTDAFERPATEWKLKAEKIGVYYDAPDLTYTTATKIGDIYADLGLSSGISKNKVTGYVDGASGFWYEGAAAATLATDVVKGNRNELGAKGSVLDVYYDADTDSLTIVQVNTYVGKVTAAYAKTTTKDAYVTLNVNASDDFTNPSVSVGSFETDLFAKDDIVAYTYSFKTGENCIESMSSTEKVSGTMSTFTTQGSVTVAGTKYDANAKSKANVVSTLNGDVDNKSEVDVYLDANGYVLYLEANTADQYAVLLDYAGAARLEPARAKLLFADGTVKKVDLNKVYKDAAFSTAASPSASYTSANSDVSKYDIVKYRVKSDGAYDLALIGDSADTQSGASPNGTPIITNGSNSINMSGTAQNVDGKTIFLVENINASGDKTYSVYVGFANVPSATVKASVKSIAATYTKTVGTPVDVVFLQNDVSNVNMFSTNKDVLFIKGSGVGQSYTTELGYYYEYDAVLNGEEIKVKTATGYAKKTVVYNPQYNDKGILTGAEASVNEDGAVGTGLAYTTGTYAISNDVIQLGATYYAVDKNVEVYMFSVDGDLTKIDIKSVAEDLNDLVWFKVNDKNQITEMFIQVVDTPNGVGGGSSTYTATLATTYGSPSTISLTVSGTPASASFTYKVYAFAMAAGRDTAVEVGSGSGNEGTAVTVVGSSNNTQVYYAVVTMANGDVVTTATVAG